MKNSPIVAKVHRHLSVEETRKCQETLHPGQDSTICLLLSADRRSIFILQLFLSLGLFSTKSHDQELFNMFSGVVLVLIKWKIFAGIFHLPCNLCNSINFQ